MSLSNALEWAVDVLQNNRLGRKCFKDINAPDYYTTFWTAKVTKFNSTSLRNDKEEEGDIGSHLEGHQASVQLLALVDLSNEEVAVASVHLCVRDVDHVFVNVEVDLKNNEKKTLQIKIKKVQRKRINHKHIARWQHLSQFKARDFLFEFFLLGVKKYNLYLRLVTPSSCW